MKINLKILNIFFSAILILYPLGFAATSVYALPSLPGTPSTPDSPEDPDTPLLPGEEEAIGTTSTSEPSSTTTDGNSNTGNGEVISSNTDTGADSTNNADTTIDNNTEVDINNNADVDNLLNVDADSGGNDTDKNTGDGSISTGDAAIDGNLANNANSINIGSLECSTECNIISIGSLELGNSNTGAGSTNDSNTTLNNDSSLGIDNDTDFNNLVMFDADSGDNSASYNTGNGTVETGDAEIILTAINAANNVNVNYEVFNVYDDQTGDIIIDFDSLGGSPFVVGGLGSSNDSTGADSNNTSTTDANNTTQILIDNNGNIVNNYYLDANSGDNTTDKNTGDGSVTTGDANVVFNLINFLNNAFLGGGGELLIGIVNIFGNYGGNIVLDGLDSAGTPNWGGYLVSNNNTTGADSNNNADTSLNSDTDISLNNSADILNNLTLDANTGDNDANKNTGSGSISTGNTNISVNVTNVGNNTVIGDGGTIWMVLVNNLGTWTGQLFDTGSTGEAYSPFFTFSLAPDGSLTASNQNTGTDSSNEASTSIDNDTDIAITNTATITNNVMIDANTGGNSASYNSGSGNITTGDANITANIVNMFNNIFLSGRFALTIVNIFGTFSGDILQASGAIGSVIIVDPKESIAISPNKINSSPNSPIFYGVSNLDLGNNGLDKNEKDNSSSLVLAANQSDPTSTSVFTADRGLFDDFKLSYLIFPVIFGIIFSLSRRVFLRR